MSLISLIAVFLIEQLQPLSYGRLVERPLRSAADFLESRFNAGEYRQGVLAWALFVLPAVALAGGLYWALNAISPLLALLLNIGILYLTMGFRQFSHHFTEIQLALRLGELERARRLLAEWQGVSTHGLGSADIARLSIRAALAASHRHVFAVLLWFVLLPGPCGAVLYRLAAVLNQHWGQRGNSHGFFIFARQAFTVIDWLPARATASAFAVVGDFEDAVYCWRTQAGQWRDDGLGIVLASGAGALGVNLGASADDAEAAAMGDAAAAADELGVGDAVDVESMQSAVGLVWRATVLWVLLLFLLGLASLAG